MTNNKPRLLEFLQSQRAMALASHDGSDLWIANVFVGVDDEFNIFFISNEGAKHSQQIIQNPDIAFSTVWFNENNHTDRKGVQGLGNCKIATDEGEIVKGVQLHNKNYPEFKDLITVDWIRNNEDQSKMWVLRPKFIKFWNDEFYDEEETEEFSF